MALIRPVPGSIATIMRASLSPVRSWASRCFFADFWIFGSIVVTMRYPPVLSLFSRSALSVPNAFCSSHHRYR